MFKTRYYINYRVINSQLIKLEGSLGWVFKSLTCCYEANLRPWSRSKYILKGTVSVISSDPLGKDNNARFTTVPLKALSDQVWIGYPCFCFYKLFIFICGFSVKVTWALFLFIWESQYRDYLESITFLIIKTTVSFTFPIRLRFQGYHCHCCLENRLKLRLQSL